MDIIKALETRYSTKKFDPKKKISAENMEKIESMLQLLLLLRTHSHGILLLQQQKRERKELLKVQLAFMLLMSIKF